MSTDEIANVVREHGNHAEIRNGTVWGEAVGTRRLPNGTIAPWSEWQRIGRTAGAAYRWLGY